jgi:nucleoside-diphosphate-sugar epimerase
LDLQHSPANPSAENLELLSLDIRNAEAMREAVAGVDVVFHLASAHLQVHAASDWYESINVDAVASLVDACRRGKVGRLVHVSSVGIYGDVTDPPANEDSPKNPVNRYEKTKLSGETLALQEAANAGVELFVLRPGWVYGPGCPRTTKLLRTIRKRRFFFIGAATNLRHPIYVADAVEACVLAADAPKSGSGRPYLVVGPRAITVRELVTSCAEALEVASPSIALPRSLGAAAAHACEIGFGLFRANPPFSRRSLAFFDNNNSFDGSAAVQALGFQPKIDLKQGLRQSVATLDSPSLGTCG